MKHIPVAIALVLVIIGFLPGRQPATGPVASALSSAPSSDRAKVSAIYRALADVTERDAGEQIATMSIWRDVHRSALRLAAGDIKGKYAGLAEAVEKVLAEHVSLDDVAMSKEQVGKVVAGCREVERQSK
jgi:hypothetical protein